MPLNDSARTRAISTSSAGRRWSFETTTLTRVPMAAKIEAYSQPTAPPPRTRSDPGARSMPRMLSTSCTSGSSGGTPGSCLGREPEARSTTWAWSTIRSPKALDLNPSVGKEPRPPADLLDAVTHEVALDGLGHELRHLDLAGHEQTPGVLSARGGQLTRALPQPAQVDGSLAQGLGRDAGDADGDTTGRGLGSTIATRLPKYAAWAAPFSPAGPAPTTTRS